MQSELKEEDKIKVFPNNNLGGRQKQIPNPLSKTQQKKQRRLLEYEKYIDRRRVERLKRYEKKCPAFMSNKLPMDPVDPNRLKVAIDLDYDHKMSDIEILMTVNQCCRINESNQISKNPLDVHFTGIRLGGRIHSVFERKYGSENWGVKFHYNQSHLEAFDNEKIVYLSPQSHTILEKFDDDKVYIIGGLTGHKHGKGYCHVQARKAGLQTARLPLSEHVNMGTRSILSTYTVFAIMLRLNEGKSWPEAILSTVPKSKHAKPKVSAWEMEESDDFDDE